MTDLDGPLSRRPSTPWLLRGVTRRYGAIVASRLQEAGLRGLPRPGYWVLMALSAGVSDATGLVAAVAVTKQAVSKTLDALVAEGFVARRTNGTDRRRTDLVLTDKGTRTVRVIRDALATAEGTFVTEVGTAAWETTVATLDCLARGEA